MCSVFKPALPKGQHRKTTLCVSVCVCGTCIKIWIRIDLFVYLCNTFFCYIESVFTFVCWTSFPLSHWSGQRGWSLLDFLHAWPLSMRNTWILMAIRGFSYWLANFVAACRSYKVIKILKRQASNSVCIMQIRVILKKIFCILQSSIFAIDLPSLKIIIYFFQTPKVFPLHI